MERLQLHLSIHVNGTRIRFLQELDSFPPDKRFTTIVHSLNINVPAIQMTKNNKWKCEILSRKRIDFKQLQAVTQPMAAVIFREIIWWIEILSKISKLNCKNLLEYGLCNGKSRVFLLFRVWIFRISKHLRDTAFGYETFYAFIEFS